MAKQITIKELKEIAHIADNNHLACVLANHYYAEYKRVTKEGYVNAGKYYLDMWNAIVEKLDELKLDELEELEEEEN